MYYKSLKDMQIKYTLIVILLFACSSFIFAIDIPDTSDIKSFESLKFVGVHEQGADKSCGLSVISSILNLYLGHDINETKLIDQFRKTLQESKEVSMAQMINIFQTYGYVSKVYKVNFDNLVKAVNLYSPVIVHYKKPDLHFAFILYADNDKLITADPVSGIEVQDVNIFKERWSGVALLIKVDSDKLNSNLLNDSVKQAIKKHNLLKKLASNICEKK